MRTFHWWRPSVSVTARDKGEHSPHPGSHRPQVPQDQSRWLTGEDDTSVGNHAGSSCNTEVWRNYQLEAENQLLLTVLNSGAGVQEVDSQSSASNDPMILKRVYMRKVKKTSMRAIVTHTTDLINGVRVSASMKLGITPAGGVRAGTWVGSKEDMSMVEEDGRPRHTLQTCQRADAISSKAMEADWCGVSQREGVGRGRLS